MESLGLILGHLLGDYVLQNDWQARLKSARHPGEQPYPTEEQAAYGEMYALMLAKWKAAIRDSQTAPLACTVHCLLYTLAVWACSFWWMPWWGLVACFVAHWPVDRYRLAYKWMTRVSGQTSFAHGPLAPWSVIVVDQCWHLLTLFLIGLAVFTPWR